MKLNVFLVLLLLAVAIAILARPMLQDITEHRQCAKDLEQCRFAEAYYLWGREQFKAQYVSCLDERSF